MKIAKPEPWESETDFLERSKAIWQDILDQRDGKPADPNAPYRRALYDDDYFEFLEEQEPQ